MMSKASADTKQSPKGVLGNVLEGVTGQMKTYNEALEKHTRLKVEQAEASASLTKAEEKLRLIEKATQAHRIKSEKAKKKAVERTKELRKEISKLRKEQNKNSREMTKSNARMEGMSKKGGILSNGLTILAAKTAGLAATMSSFSAIVESLDKRMRYAGAAIADTGEITGDFWTTTKKIKDEALIWNDVINKTNEEMRQMGYSVKETDAIMSSLSKGLRLTTEDQATLAQQTGDMAADIGRLSVLLRTNTEDLANATIVASKKFGKGAKAMNADLTMMHYGLTELKAGSKDAVLHLGDLTQQVLESQASFQGYNLNLRDQARLMGQISIKAQEQGATYEQSMKAAKGLSDIISGGAAPDWAKYIAGNEMLKEVKKLNKAAKGDMAGFKAELEKTYGEEMVGKMSKAQITGLKTMAKDYKKFGHLSAANMTEELLRGTEVGNKEMFKLLKKYGSGREGRELLKRVWGLDDAAATAATLALTTADSYDELVGIKDKAETEMKKRKQPSIADLEDQTTGMVRAVNVSQKGIQDSIKNFLDHDSPVVKAIIGAGGLGMSAALQLAQTGMLSKMAGGAAGGIGGAGGALGKVGTAGKWAAGVAAAGAAGYMFGTKLREWSDALAESTGIQYLSIDKLSQTGLEGLANHVHLMSAGLLDWRVGLEGAAEAQKLYTYQLEKGGEAERERMEMIQKAAKGEEISRAEYAKAALNLKTFNLSAAELEGMAEALGVTTKSLEKLWGTNLETAEHQKALGEWRRKRGIVAPAVREKGPLGTGAAAAAARERYTTGVASSADTRARKAKKAKPLPTVTIPRLTPQMKQAAAMQVAEKLEPEVAQIANTMFEQLSAQGTEYYENLTSVSQVFWMDTLPKMAELAWDGIAVEFEKKLDRIAGPAMMPIAFGEEGAGPTGGAGPGSIGGMAAAVGPDGSITVKMMIPRDAIDASNRTASQYTDR